MPNPYVGPRPFETGQPLFGRTRELTELRYLLTSERSVLLYSPSGAGKSSLVNAGLIPQLATRFDVRRPTRVNTEAPRYGRQSLCLERRLPRLGRRPSTLDRHRLPPGEPQPHPRRMETPGQHDRAVSPHLPRTLKPINES
jgi:hypothetical protein